jgi:polyribonucleotide nucleotidyltransferase
MSKTGIQKTFNLPDGREITLETGKLATQSDGSVVVKMDDTMLLATVVSSKEPREGVDFLPLTVEYQEKYAATGRFPGGFFKREARPSEYEILIARLVDRALRPLFPDYYYNETQLLVSLISGDRNTLPDAMVALAASAALMVSDIPFKGPISEVRVARIDGKFFINPSVADIKRADMDLIVAGTMENISMVEGELKEASEKEMLEALRIAHDAIKQQCNAQIELAGMVEKSKIKREHLPPVEDEELKEKVWKETYDKIYAIAKLRHCKTCTERCI